MNAIQLVICDVDGTLVTSKKELTPATLRAARQLRDRGVKLALTSGRPPLGMKMLTHPLELETPLACFNGGVFADPDLRPLEVQAIEPEVASQVIERLTKSGADVWVYTEHDWYLRDVKKAHVDREQWTVKFAPLVVESFVGLTGSIVKIVGVSDEYESLARCEKALLDELRGAISASRSWPYYLDVTSPLANKGYVVDYFSRHYGLALDAIAAIGDGCNDTMMFKKAGLGIAVGNANDAVKHSATVTVASNDEDGFSEAVDRYILAHRQAA
jgi:Cof subfamily protein (haloacid dehalogenase superfamily)